MKTAALILGSSTRMSGMVSDLVDFTRTRLGAEIPLARMPVDLGVILQDTVEEIEAAHPQYALLLTKTGNLRAHWDEARMKQELANLIQNAVQHGTSGAPITVTATGNGDQIGVTVHNEGAPIPQQELIRIFEPLVTADETSSPVISAHMGLGIYIARKIVEPHGGIVEVVSTQLAGTTFTVKLPRAAH